MDLGLRGKTALITGGSAGIGLACATLLATEGVDVAIVSRTQERLVAAAAALRSVAAGARVHTVAADIGEAAGVTNVVRDVEVHFGRIDILINCAGSAQGGSFVDLPDEAFLTSWNLKLLGYIRMTRAVVPAMIARRDGRIVNIVGGAGRLPAAEFLTGSTTNAALINFTRGLSKALAPHNVRINAISPGTTQTQRGDRSLAAEVAAGKTIEEARADRAKTFPLGRITQPEEIASMAALIVSDRMPSMTGTEVLVDGGVMPAV
jgi:NAD(P)-dependent dehydrogenase (short-subunit alcohol dehydrogenase family)